MYYIRFYVKNHKMYCKSLGGAKYQKKTKVAFYSVLKTLKMAEGMTARE